MTVSVSVFASTGIRVESPVSDKGMNQGQIIGGSRIFFRGGLKDDFIRMCTDCIAVKIQLLR